MKGAGKRPEWLQNENAKVALDGHRYRFVVTSLELTRRMMDVAISKGTKLVTGNVIGVNTVLDKKGNEDQLCRVSSVRLEERDEPAVRQTCSSIGALDRDGRRLV